MAEEPRVRSLVAKLDTPDVAALTRELVQFLGQSSVEKRLRRMRRALETERGVYREHWVMPNNRWFVGLEYLMGLFSGPMPTKIQLTKDAEWVLESALKLKTLLPGMPSAIRSQLAGRMTGAGNLNPVLLELNMAAHLWQTGREIMWLTSAGAPGKRISEFVARGGPGDVEVECKSKTLDAGRMVTRPAFYRLVDGIHRHLKQHSLYGDVRVEPREGMPLGKWWRDGIVGSLPIGPEKGSTISQDCLVSWRLFQGGKVVIPGITGADELAAPHLEPFAHVAVFAETHGTGVRCPIVIKALSKAPDWILRSIERDLEDAAAQLSGGRPGIIYMYLPDVEDLPAVRDDGMLERVVRGAFERHPEKRIAAICFVVDPVTNYTAFGLSTEFPMLTYANDAA